MTQPIAFPDIESALVPWLRSQLSARGDTVRVGTKMPTNRPPRMVRVVPRLGGTLRDFKTDRPRLVIECHSDDEIAAADLARTVRALVGSAAGGWIGDVWCDRVDDAGLAFSPDPDTGSPRYLLTVELHVSGSPL